MRLLSALMATGMIAACAPPPGPAAGPAPARVTYLLSGVVSGPYRLDADLRTGEVDEARPTALTTGAAYAADPAGIPITSRATLPASDLEALRGLASHVWEYGADKADACETTADAVAVFKLEQDGAARSYTVASSCMSDEASELQVRIACGANPRNPGCLAN